MATLADLKIRIVAETARDDLESGGESAPLLLTHIQDACDYYASERFWFNTGYASVSTVAGTATVTSPVRIANRVTIPATGAELTEERLEELPVEAASGEPTHFVNEGSTIRLYPTPDAVYALRAYGITSVAAPSADADTSIWTNEAAKLISARTRYTLYRDAFKDTENATLAKAAEQEELARLKRETGKRMNTAMRAPLDIAVRYGRTLNY